MLLKWVNPELTKTPHNGQSQPGAAIFARGRRISLGKGLKEPLHLLLRHADPRVFDLKLAALPPVYGAAPHLQLDRALVGELAGIAQQIEQDLSRLRQVCPHGPEVLAVLYG